MRRSQHCIQAILLHDWTTTLTFSSPPSTLSDHLHLLDGNPSHISPIPAARAIAWHSLALRRISNPVRCIPWCISRLAGTSSSRIETPTVACSLSIHLEELVVDLALPPWGYMYVRHESSTSSDRTYLVVLDHTTNTHNTPVTPIKYAKNGHMTNQSEFFLVEQHPRF